tara:strand:+ start:11097 stop:13649 length:2553 start_codon:yes stop_codon:yes gene_type:complete
MLTLPANYSSSIGQHMQENYLVQLFNETSTTTPGLYLSVVDTTVSSVAYKGVITNIPKIKESIDLTKSTASLSNVSISCADDDGSGGLLSDDLLYSAREYINRDVKIFSQLDDNDTIDNCLLIYQGRLRAVQMSENKITLQISSLRPFENMNAPITETKNGNYVPLVFGDYASGVFSLTGSDLGDTSVKTHPVEVEKVDGGQVFTVAHEQGSSVSSGFLHWNEGNVYRKTGSQNMAKMDFFGTSESGTAIDAKDGSSTIYGRKTNADLKKYWQTRTGLSNGSSGVTISSDKETATFSVTNATIGSSVQYSFDVTDIGRASHSPKSISFKIDYSNISASFSTSFTKVETKIDVFWDMDAGSPSASVSDYLMDSYTVSGTSYTGGSGSTDMDANKYIYHETTTTAGYDTSTFEITANNGQLPDKITVKVIFTGSGTFNLSGTAKCYFQVWTAIEQTEGTRQSDAEIANSVTELYSAQDGLSINSELIKTPIAAHRYICETFMPTTFTSSNESDNYTAIFNYMNAGVTGVAATPLLRGQMNWWLNKSEKLEDILEKLQHFGGFIMRYKNDGTFDYMQAGTYLPVSTTASTVQPYLLQIGTLQTSGGSGVDGDDVAFGIDYTHGSETLANGDIIALKNSSGGIDNYEFIKVFSSDASITGADATFENCDRDLPPSNVNRSWAEDSVIYKVMFPHSKLTKQDIAQFQISHLPLQELVTKWKINYNRNPAESSKYLNENSYDNSTIRTLYNMTTENIKEIKNEIDAVGTLSNFYQKHYNNILGDLKIKVSFEIVNPAFYNIEVGDYIQFDGTNLSHRPFGYTPNSYTNDYWAGLYFIVTSTTKTMGKISVSAYEVL